MAHYPFQLKSLPHFVEFIYFDNAFLPHELNLLNQYWEEENSKKAELEGDQQYNDQLRQSSVIGIEASAATNWIFDRMSQLIHQCNDQRYHFDITGIYEPLQLAQYAEGDFFDWHLDFGPGASSNRKLSLTMQLSDESDYEGGDLEFQVNNQIIKAPRTKGSVIIFPSFIMHRVNKITKGNRRSLVGWISGPAFR